MSNKHVGGVVAPADSPTGHHNLDAYDPHPSPLPQGEESLLPLGRRLG